MNIVSLHVLQRSEEEKRYANRQTLDGCSSLTFIKHLLLFVVANIKNKTNREQYKSKGANQRSNERNYIKPT